MFQAVLHLCWLNLRFPSAATSIAPLIDADPRRRHPSPVEAKREFWWDDRLVRFHLAYDRHCRGTDKPIPLEEAWRQFSDGPAYVQNGFQATLPRLLAKHLKLDQDRKSAEVPVVSFALRTIDCIVVAIWQRLGGKITVTNRRIHEKLSTKIDFAIL